MSSYAKCNTSIQTSMTKETKKLKTNLGLSFLAFIVSGCGGGGPGQNSTNSNSNNSNNQNDSSFSSSSGEIFAPVGSELIISQINGTYKTSNLAGFSQTDVKKAVYQVSDDSRDDTYTVKLNATGAGVLEFKFDDAKDEIVLSDDSIISGFSTLKVTNGTLDASRADLGSVKIVEIASSITINAQQLSEVDTIVSNSLNSKVTIEIGTADDLEAIEARVQSGLLKIYSAGKSLDFVKSLNANIDDTTLTASLNTLNSSVKPVASKPTLNVSDEAMLVKKSLGQVKILNDDTFVNASEIGADLKFTAVLEKGYSVKSAKFGDVSLSEGTNDGEFVISASQVTDGTYDVVFIVEDILGIETTLSGQVTIDTEAPEVVDISIEGESNGLNSNELANNPKLFIALPEGISINSATLSGISLVSDEDGNYSLVGADLADGNSALVVEISDQAGNTTTLQKTITVDATSPNEPKISIEGGENGLNASELLSDVDISIQLDQGTSLTALTVDGVAIDISEAGVYSFDATGFSDGSHTINATVVDASGNTAITTKSFLVDTVAPEAALIQLMGDDNVLSREEAAENTLVFIENAAGSSVVSAKFAGSNLVETDTSGLYELDARNLDGGVSKIEVVTSDIAGNTTTAVQDVIVLGSSSSKDPFSFTTSQSGDTIDFKVYFVNDPTGNNTKVAGIGATFYFDNSVLDYVDNSLKAAAGGLRVSAVTDDGGIRGSAAYLAPFSEFDTPIYTFSATKLSEVNFVEISVTDLQIGDDSLSNASYFVEI